MDGTKACFTLTQATDYPQWRTLMKIHLEVEDRWTVISNPNRTTRDFARQDAEVRRTLLTHLDKKYITAVASCGDASEVWNSLERKFMGEKQFVLERLGRAMVRINSNVLGEVLDQFEDLVGKYRMIGGSLPDSELVYKLFEVLPEYPAVLALKSQIRSNNADEGVGYDLDAVIGKFRQLAFDTGGRPPDIPKESKEKDKSKGPRCYNCGKNGHVAKNCPDKAGNLAMTATDAVKEVDDGPGYIEL